MNFQQPVNPALAAAVEEGRRDSPDMRSRLLAIFVGSIGNLVEWYDFYAYSAFALYFAKSFFPEGNEVVQQLNAALLFAAGFLVRPLGGWLFGHLADHHGRRNALTLSVLMMCFGSLIIAVTPTYASIGFAAPLLLGFARIVQGVSLGGEYGASATYLSEVADEKNRGFYSSFQYVTLIGGQLCAVVVLLLLQKVFLNDEQLRAWGWRIPFVIGAMLAIVAAVMRRNLHETDAFTRAKSAEQVNSLRALSHFRREVLLVVGLTMGGTAAFYTYTTYMQKYLKLSVKLTDDQTTMVTACSLIFAMALQPLYGALSDRIGRKWLLIGFGVGGTLFTDSTSEHAARSPRTARGLLPDRGSLVDRIRLYVDQCRGQSRTVSDRDSSDGRGAAIRIDGFDFRRHGRADCALVQVDRARKLVLLLSHRLHRDLPGCLSHHARHQKAFGDRSRVSRLKKLAERCIA